MDLSNFASMDVHMLMSIVNMKLRDEHGDIDNLVRAFDIDKAALIEKLATGDYHYNEQNNQFR
ncbi:DUF4250 domain-containing protein [Aliivibrio kagoshimensis]|uniref:DUF4250 domain-containing protein n=1 Tax=Aliivibrio kagoshimensis TaxID=2910230 RepID=UPI003D0EFBCC